MEMARGGVEQLGNLELGMGGGGWSQKSSDPHSTTATITSAAPSRTKHTVRC